MARSKPRIGIDARGCQWPGNGVSSYTTGLIRALLHHDDFDFYFVVQHGLPLDTSIFEDARCLYRTNVKKNNWLVRDIWEQTVLPRQLAAADVDLYHGLDYTIPLVPTPFVKVSTMHDATVFGPFDSSRWLASQRSRWHQRALAKAADLIITDSEFSVSSIASHMPWATGKICPIWLGVADSFFEPSESWACESVLNKVPKEKPYVLYYGGFRKNKNIPLLLAAYAEVASNFDVDLVLVGQSGAHTPALKQNIESLGLTERVRSFGFAHEEELKVLLDRCSLFVFPSLAEGFGLPVSHHSKAYFR